MSHARQRAFQCRTAVVPIGLARRQAVARISQSAFAHERDGIVGCCSGCFFCPTRRTRAVFRSELARNLNVPEAGRENSPVFFRLSLFFPLAFPRFIKDTGQVLSQRRPPDIRDNRGCDLLPRCPPHGSVSDSGRATRR